jgi:hypothetical protein
MAPPAPPGRLPQERTNVCVVTWRFSPLGESFCGQDSTAGRRQLQRGHGSLAIVANGFGPQRHVMTFLVFCVFDLKGATREDYLYAYMDLATLGLRQTVKSDNGPSFRLPAAAVMGTFDGRNVEEVRSTVSRKVQGIFKGRGLNGTFFLVASHDWACAGEAT